VWPHDWIRRGIVIIAPQMYAMVFVEPLLDILGFHDAVSFLVIFCVGLVPFKHTIKQHRIFKVVSRAALHIFFFNVGKLPSQPKVAINWRGAPGAWIHAAMLEILDVDIHDCIKINLFAFLDDKMKDIHNERFHDVIPMID
jgi:hypothetical protein